MPYIVEFEMFIWFSLWARFGYRFKVYFCLGLGNFFDGLILGLRRAASPRALRPGSSSVFFFLNLCPHSLPSATFLGHS